MLLQPQGDRSCGQSLPGTRGQHCLGLGSLHSPGSLNWPLLAKVSLHTAGNILGSLCCLGLREPG